MEKKKVFVPVNVKDELPPLTEYNGISSKDVYVIMNKETYTSANGAICWGDPGKAIFPATPETAYYTKDGWCWSFGEPMNQEHGKQEITHWLKEQELYCFTKEQLEKLLENVVVFAVDINTLYSEYIPALKLK